MKCVYAHDILSVFANKSRAFKHVFLYSKLDTCLTEWTKQQLSRFQRNWATLKEEVTNAVKLFFLTGHMPDGVDETAIVLIPKIEQPETLKDFRPISLSLFYIRWLQSAWWID